MTTARRWLVVALAVALLASLPFALRALPVADSGASAGGLLAKVQESSSVAYSGYVESTGSLQLPVSDQFTDIADLLGGRTTMRVWWRAPDDWRVDKIDATGEHDLFRDAGGTTIWDYEANRATRTRNPQIRLPQSSDLLPPELARRLLDGAPPSQVGRIEPRSIAGVDAAGLRLTPGDQQSSIERVDVWVEAASGLPLSVEVYGQGDSRPAVSTRFIEVSLATPADEQTRLVVAPGAEVGYEDVLDIADAANQFAPFRAPRALAGLSRRDAGPGLGAVGVYGRGAAVLVQIPLWYPAARPLRDQLAVTPAAVVGKRATRLGVGPLNLLLTAEAFESTSFLVVGTVTPATLSRAAGQLERDLLRQFTAHRARWAAHG